jgi:hypothetical protein
MGCRIGIRLGFRAQARREETDMDTSRKLITRKRILFATLAVLCAVLLAVGLTVRSTVRSVPRLFRLNAELKTQGYYMGEFEFKMLASQYQMNAGHYLSAIQTLRRIETEMQDPRNLKKMPANATPEERMEFLLDRQDPVTGAFMDRDYPLFSYFAPTCNVVEALMRLSRETGRPLKLKYPLRFLDQIGTPQQLRTYLDSLLYLNSIIARFPGPGPYGPGVSEIPAFDVLEEAGVHRFSESWKKELRRWFYETQDPASGFWGARIGDAGQWRQKKDINSTFHILKLVLTDTGENQDAAFPLRFGDKLARGILDSMDLPIPENTVDQHDWGLVQYQGAKMLTQYLWPHLAEAERAEVRQKLRSMLVQNFRLYRPADGGFAYYTTDARADVDGTGLATGVLKILGVLSGTWERERLWGSASEGTLAPKRISVERWEQATLPDGGEAGSKIESFRIYRDRLPSATAYDDSDLVQIVYPRGAKGLDTMDLRQGLTRFLNADGASYGNWNTKEGIKELPLGLEREVKAVPVQRDAFDLAGIARDHPEAQRFYAVGYDITQVPVTVVEFVRNE